MKQKLIATKALTYATRRLQAGDEFDASNRDARLLIAVKRAKVVKVPREPGRLAPPPPSIKQAVQPAAAPAPVDDVAALRDEYNKAVGKRPFHGWGALELRKRIAAANV